MTPADGAGFPELAADSATQTMVEGHLPTDGSEIRSQDLIDLIRQEPGWQKADTRKIGRVLGEMWKVHGVFKRSGDKSGVYTYSRRPKVVVDEDSTSEPSAPPEPPSKNLLAELANNKVLLDDIGPPDLEPPPPMERRVARLQFEPAEETEGTTTIVDEGVPFSQTALAVRYSDIFVALWTRYSDGDFVPPHVKTPEDFGLNSGELTIIVKEMVVRKHAVSASLKRGVHFYSGYKLTELGRQRFQEWSGSETQPSEPAAPPVPPAAPEAVSLLAAFDLALLRIQLAAVQRGLVAHIIGPMEDVLRRQPPEIQAAALVELARRIGLPLTTPT